MNYEDFKKKPHNWGLPENEIWRRYHLYMEQEMFKQLHLQLLESRGESSSSSSSAGGGQTLSEPPPSDPYDRLLWQANINGAAVPSSSQQIVHRQIIANLQTYGIWNELDVLYVYAQNGSEGFSLLNWKDATANSITKINLPVWTSDTGWYIGTGILRHNYIMNQGQNFQLDSAGFFFYTGTVGSPNTRWLGSGPGGSAPFRLRVPGSSYYNSAAVINDTPAPLSNNLYAGYRLDSSNLRFYNGLTPYDRILTPTTSRMNFPVELGLGFAVDATVKIFGAGANLNSKHSDLNTILSDYISGL